jgi:hypothetical protein
MEKEKRENLLKLYDVCNEIFKKYDECFYTKEQVKELKKDSENIFIK